MEDHVRYSQGVNLWLKLDANQCLALDSRLCGLVRTSISHHAPHRCNKQPRRAATIIQDNTVLVDLGQFGEQICYMRRSEYNPKPLVVVCITKKLDVKLPYNIVKLMCFAKGINVVIDVRNQLHKKTLVSGQRRRFGDEGEGEFKNLTSFLRRCRRDLCGNWLSGVSPAGWELGWLRGEVNGGGNGKLLAQGLPSVHLAHGDLAETRSVCRWA